ncbi:hypothetical protein NQ318_015218 [Aromia moschata]|uniref:Uncharacterized protein n=1 Tax=Aromia moschata TaxID=1265417 RepID=A0AAV8XL42_9CUCU|nr:hypothetical protein NQ318_015218 [Aromia moschata]
MIVFPTRIINEQKKFGASLIVKPLENIPIYIWFQISCSLFDRTVIELGCDVEKTGVTLELLTDVDMLHFFRKGILGVLQSATENLLQIISLFVVMMIKKILLFTEHKYGWASLNLTEISKLYVDVIRETKTRSGVEHLVQKFNNLRTETSQDGEIYLRKRRNLEKKKCALCDDFLIK